MSKINGDKRYYEDMLKWYKNNINSCILKPDAYIIIEIPTEISIDRIKKEMIIQLLMIYG